MKPIVFIFFAFAWNSVFSTHDATVFDNSETTSTLNHISSLDNAAKHSRRLESKKGAYHHKMYAHNGTDTHKKSWMVLEQVNGLKNEEVAVFVTSTNNYEGAFLRER